MKLKYPLRPWQQVAMRQWKKHGRKGIIQVVTGGGKTVFAEACILDYFRAVPGGKALIIVPSVALADQWAVSLKEEMDCPSSKLAVIRGKKPKGNPDIFIMVINTARNKEKYLDVDSEWMLIVDECHRAGSEENKKALRGSFNATLGLSATPERQYDNALEETIEPALGPVIYDYGLVEAKRDGVITPFDLINVEVSLLSDEKKEYNRLSKVIGMKCRNASINKQVSLDDSVTQLLQRRARIAAKATMRIPVAVKIAEKHRGSQIMIFHEDIMSAERIASILKERGGSVTVYHTKIGPAIRLSNLLLYRRRVYASIVSCRALDEGINIPETQVAIIASATATMRQRVQRLGRVLRPAKSKDKAIVYTIYATEVEQKRLIEEEKVLSDTADISWMKVEVSNAN